MAMLLNRQKPHAAIGSGVVAGRAHDAEGVVCAALCDQIDRVQAGADGVKRGFV